MIQDDAQGRRAPGPVPRPLHEIAVAVGGLVNPTELARIVVERSIALLGADAAGVYLWEPGD